MIPHTDTTHLAEPPPTYDLVDRDRLIGRVTLDSIRFFGFATADEAAQAARLAHRTMLRRLARHDDRLPMRHDHETLAIDHRTVPRAVLLGGERIATILEHDGDHVMASAAGAPGFGFALDVPAAIHALRARAIACLVYRTLRNSSVPWAMWARDDGANSILMVQPTTEPTGRNRERARGMRDATVDRLAGLPDAIRLAVVIAGPALRLVNLAALLLLVALLQRLGASAEPGAISLWSVALAGLVALVLLERWPSKPMRARSGGTRALLHGIAMTDRAAMVPARQWASIVTLLAATSLALLLATVAAGAQASTIQVACAVTGLLLARIFLRAGERSAPVSRWQHHGTRPPRTRPTTS
jgi:hypothetical protein